MKKLYAIGICAISILGIWTNFAYAITATIPVNYVTVASSSPLTLSTSFIGAGSTYTFVLYYGIYPAGVNHLSGSGTPCSSISDGNCIVTDLTFSGTDITGEDDVWIAFCNQDEPCQSSGNDYSYAILKIDGVVQNTLNVATRIISISPDQNEIIATTTSTTTPVDFNLHAYINEDDLSTFAGVKVTFENIDQNVIFSGLSDYSYTFLDRVAATSSGDFLYSTTTELAAGNYRVTAELERTTLFGVINPFSGFLGTIDELSHNFVVGTSTWLGNQQANMFENIANIYGGLEATTTEAKAKKCIPFSSEFGVIECFGFLFVPDTGQLTDTLTSFRDGVLVRVPWGYFTRFVTIMSGSATTTLPAISLEFDPNGPMAGVTWDVRPDEIIAAGGAFMDSVEDRDGNTLQDVLEPLIKIIVGLALIFQIVHDLTGSHAHHSERRNN